jgi:hypothetical protein
MSQSIIIINKNLQQQFENKRYSDVENVVAMCGSKLPPLKGVFHLAGVSADGNLIAQDTTLYHHSFCS